jgi:hypothetical protein
MSRLIGAFARFTAAFGVANWALRELRGPRTLEWWSSSRRQPPRRLVTALGLAGGFLIARALAPKLMIALNLRRGRSVGRSGRSIVGQTLPTIRGRTLGGRDVKLPDDAHGLAAMLVLGFAYDARFDVEDWVQAYEERFGSRAGLVVYELPMISNLYRPVAAPIEAGMRQGTPLGFRDRVVTVYGWPDRMREALGADRRADTWVIALDRDGTVLYEYGGPFDEDRFGELASALTAGARAT